MQNNLHTRELQNIFFLGKEKIEIPFAKEEVVLLGISGGLDSMVMLDFFRVNKFSIHVAHVNYGLRGEDSDLDEELVRNYCSKYKIPLHIKNVNFSEHKQSRHSLQMIARDIRYDFYKEIQGEFKIKFLATAHHLDDQIETFFINIFRGSGLKGLSGIKSTKSVFRPLLGISKEYLLDYATENTIPWREDKSNKKRDYLRNKLRLDIIPSLKELNSQFSSQLEKSILYIQQAEKIIEKKSKKDFKKILHFYDKKEDTYFLKKHKMLNLNPTILHYIFTDFGGISIHELYKLIQSRVGVFHETSTHRFWIDYKYFIIEPLNANTEEVCIEIQEKEFKLKNPLKIKSRILSQLDATAEAWFDADKLLFPLKIRSWKTSDVFYPLKMNGTKKISKYLRDEKISTYFKRKVLVLTNANDDIIWIINHRADERFRVTDTTRNILNVWL
ncbi:MAG: tRNA lysidine(34) synthetase TilS [Flavobacteriales bacterium]|nr:tRNA lysidine(34) synthetase TilS [Flavobacteriales bacterium]